MSDARQGYAVNDTLIVSADILVLDESVSFTREAELANSANGTALVSVRRMALRAWRSDSQVLFPAAPM